MNRSVVNADSGIRATDQGKKIGLGMEFTAQEIMIKGVRIRSADVRPGSSRMSRIRLSEGGEGDEAHGQCEDRCGRPGRTGPDL